MNKIILIKNYNPLKLKEARETANLTYEDLENYDIDTEFIKIIESSNPITQVDIFFIAYLFILYEEEALKKDVKFSFSLTKDILIPHPCALKYQIFIAGHKNYQGMPLQNGRIKWVASAKSKDGQERIKFWEKKRQELGIEANHVSEPGIRQKVAFANHPTKIHVCLYSGSNLYIDYRYPSKKRIDMLNKEYSQDLKYFDLDIYQIAELLFNIDRCKKFSKVFRLSKRFNDIDELLKVLKKDYVIREYKSFVSPGVMSNLPDRFDGYHSYNNDIREIADTGRYKDNLKKYTQDRRVYEMWSGGDWKMADRLYATFVKHGVSPDHIGPISLGFAHRPKFQPMTASQNSAKGNRMTYADIQLLINDERAGDEVITWHSKYIWDKFKTRVKNDKQAVKLSSLMRINLHHILIIFSMLNEKGHKKFLEQFLNPSYSYFDYEFIEFNPITGSYKKVITKELNGKNQQNNIERYFRIAFEKLVEYADKDNRNSKIWKSDKITKKVNQVISLLDKDKNDEALYMLHQVLRKLARLAESNW